MREWVSVAVSNIRGTRTPTRSPCASWGIHYTCTFPVRTTDPEYRCLPRERIVTSMGNAAMNIVHVVRQFHPAVGRN